MPDTLTIGLAQIAARVGDIGTNAAAIRRARAALAGADLVMTPELGLVGYPPEDLVLKPAFIEAAAAELARLARDTADGGPALLVGLPVARGGLLHNAMMLCAGGEVRAEVLKVELPNYGPFDEARVFRPAPALPAPVAFGTASIGLPICEDMWLPAVPAALKVAGAGLLLSPNGSPFEIGKHERRIAVARERVRETGLPLLLLNRVGGQDELAFDGASFVMDDSGAITHQAPMFEEAAFRVELTALEDGRWRVHPGHVHPPLAEPERIYAAMVMGLRDYVAGNGFPGVLIGLSGGIDSALTAAVAVDALGPDRVWCMMLPSRFTSRESLEDAAETARMLGVRLDTIPIEPAVAAFDAMLGEPFAGRPRDLTEENIQSRTRAMVLMALSNKFGHMVVSTGNKSEMSVGYTTIYGDLAGGFSVLKDIYKGTVVELSRWRNVHRTALGLGPAGPVIPERVIVKPPTAELRENQKDEDSLPPYPVLDAILIGMVEGDRSVGDLIAAGFDPDMVRRVERLLYASEYKRRQAPPGIKISARSFGKDRRYPITNAYRSGAA